MRKASESNAKISLMRKLIQWLALPQQNRSPALACGDMIKKPPIACEQTRCPLACGDVMRAHVSGFLRSGSNHRHPRALAVH